MLGKEGPIICDKNEDEPIPRKTIIFIVVVSVVVLIIIASSVACCICKKKKKQKKPVNIDRKSVV